MPDQPEEPSRSIARRWAVLLNVEPPDYSNPVDVAAFLDLYARAVLAQARKKNPDA